MATDSAAHFQGAQGSAYLFNSGPFGAYPTIQLQTHIDLPGDAARDFALGLLLRMDAPALQAVRDAADARLDALTEAVALTADAEPEKVPA